MCEDAANMLQDIGAKRSAVMSQKKEDYQSMKHEVNELKRLSLDGGPIRVCHFSVK